MASIRHFALVLLVIMVACVCKLFEGTQYPGLNVRATLIVNEISIPDKRIRIFQQGEEYSGTIPVFAVLRQLGYQAEWEDDETAVIKINGQEYEYCDQRLYRREMDQIQAAFGQAKYDYRQGGADPEGGEENFLTPEHGESSYFIERDGDEVYMTTDSFLAIMDKLGVSIDIIIDIDSRSIIMSHQ